MLHSELGSIHHRGFPGGSVGIESACQCRRLRRHGFDLWLGRSLGGGHGSPLQYSYLEYPMDRGAWQTTVHKVAETDMTEATEHSTNTHAYTHTHTYI